jgi:ABC-type dipeptide/oligopeptide/nickel transport system permease subunit
VLCGIATLVRVSIGTMVGLIAGWYDHLRRGVTILVAMWSALPSLFLASMLIPVIEQEGGRGASSVAVAIAVCVTDWTGLAVRCHLAVRSLRAAPFIEAAYVIGQHRRAILWRHVVPNIRDLVLGEAAYLMAASLLLVAELGFLSFFVGGAQESFFGGTPDPVYAEWGSMLGSGLRDRNAGIWMLLEPLIAFTVAILAFNLIAEGLRRRR